MKRLFLSILILFTALPFFALGLQHDIFLGESRGLDTAFVFGQGKVRNSVGLFFDSHYTLKETHEEYSYSYSYGSTENDSHNRNLEHIEAQTFGVYYQFDWSTTFIHIGSVGLGIDLPVQVGIGVDTGCGLNLLGSLCPAAKFEFRKFDLFLGYKFTALLYEAIEEIPFAKSSVTIGIRYNLKKGGSGKASKITKKVDTPDSSSESNVNIIPGSDIKTISE